MGGDRRGKGWRGGDEGGKGRHIDSHHEEGAETMTPMMGVGCGRAAPRRRRMRRARGNNEWGQGHIWTGASVAVNDYTTLLILVVIILGYLLHLKYMMFLTFRYCLTVRLIQNFYINDILITYLFCYQGYFNNNLFISIFVLKN
jgi:hypothetical protein